MKTKILLTSFQTWLPHQQSNSSNDILLKIQTMNCLPNISLFFIKNLPVNLELASQQVITQLRIIQPDVIICCGMAEKRANLAIESNASSQNKCLYTSTNLPELIKQLTNTNISHDAGKFVCEGLYYQVLQYIQFLKKETQCIFVHVPVLNRNNSELILNDFQLMFRWFANEVSQSTNINKDDD